jgi:hypothetical protein
VTPEIVRCTAKSGDSLTITRAQEGTTATNKTTGSTWYVELVPTAKTIQDIDDKKLDIAGGTMTGDLTIPDKIIHSGDTDTAIRFPSADTIGFETAGTRRLTIINDGRIAVNSTSPPDSDAAFQVIALTDNTNSFIVRSLGATNNPGFGIRTTEAEGRVELRSLSSTSTQYLAFNIGNNEALRITSGRDVGIGTTSPATKLDVNGDVTITDKIIHSGDTNTAIRFPSADTVTVETAGTERMRIAADGNVGIGENSPSGKLDIKRNTASVGLGSNPVLRIINDRTDTFDIRSEILFQCPNQVTAGISASYTSFASGGNFGSDLIFSTKAAADASIVERARIIATGNVGIGTASPANPLTVNGIVSPSTDDTRTLGTASLRWSEVFAGNGTINTSDATEKQDVAELNEAEQQVATALKGLIRKYRWISSVAEKGDDARIHVGVMAQDVKQAFTDAGLDAERYGVYCKDVWYTKQTEEGEAIYCESNDPDANEHVRYGVRYDQLFAFIISAL